MKCYESHPYSAHAWRERAKDWAWHPLQLFDWARIIWNTCRVNMTKPKPVHIDVVEAAPSKLHGLRKLLLKSGDQQLKVKNDLQQIEHGSNLNKGALVGSSQSNCCVGLSHSPKYFASETLASKPIKGPIFFIIAMAPVSFIKFFVWFGIASCFLCLVHWYLAVRSSTFLHIVVRNSMMKCGVARCGKHYRTHHWTFHSFCCHGVGMGSVIWKQPVLPDMQIYANETWPKCWDVSIGNFSSMHICHFSFWNFRPRLARVLLVY